jgi:hypothetical protein
MPKKLSDEPVAKNLRDSWHALFGLKQHIEKTYGTRNDWADEYVNHKEAILRLPKFKGISDMLSQMTPEAMKGRMKYAAGDYQKPPPPPKKETFPAFEEDDALTDFYRGLFKLGSMEERMAECERVRAECIRTGKSPDQMAAELRALTKNMVSAKVAPAQAHDAKADAAREKKAAAETAALRAKTSYAPGQRGAFGNKAGGGGGY